MRVIRPFLGAWVIWLGGYAALLAYDLALRRWSESSGGAPELHVQIAATVLAGAAAGYFIAASGHMPMYRRLLWLALQVPPAYMAAVTMGFAYLCAVGPTCP